MRKEVEAGLTIELLLAQKIPPFVPPNEQEIEDYLTQSPALRMMPARAHARHIFVPVSPQANENEIARYKANLTETRQHLLDGADFAQTASIVSQDGSATRGGHIGVITKGQGDPAFDAAVFSQDVGKIGPIIRSAAGLHIIQVMNRTEERPATHEEIVAHMRRQHRAEALNRYVRECMQTTEIWHSPLIRPL